MFTLGPHELIIGLGSNSPDAPKKLRQARRALRAQEGFHLLSSSPIYESDALLPDGAPESWDLPFLNAACLIDISGDLGPEEIIRILKTIEKSLGRADSPRWAPRPIDLDLLAWGRAEVRSADVTVPHPGLFERPFALLPAQDCVRDRAPHPWRYSQPDHVPQKTRIAEIPWPELVGIVNLTPDSFSDGGEALDQDKLRNRLSHLLKRHVKSNSGRRDELATIIDIGAESTRPGAIPVPWKIEIERLRPALPILRDLQNDFGFLLSLDSRHPETVEWFLEQLPLDWINDVGGFSDPRMIVIAAQTSCQLVVMHSDPISPSHDPIAEIQNWADRQIRHLVRNGISRDRIIVDPGIGFGKNAAQNLVILSRAGELSTSKLKAPILVAHSRKRFLDPHGILPPADRDWESALISARLAESGVDYLRVHDPKVHRRALTLGARLP